MRGGMVAAGRAGGRGAIVPILTMFGVLPAAPPGGFLPQQLGMRHALRWRARALRCMHNQSQRTIFNVLLLNLILALVRLVPVPLAWAGELASLPGLLPAADLAVQSSLSLR